MQTFEEWAQENFYDVAKLTPANRKHLEAAWKSETPLPVAPPVPQPGSTSLTAGGGFEAEIAAIRAENGRIDEIRQITTTACKSYVASKDKIDGFSKLCDQAIQDKWSIERFQLAMLREERNVGPMLLSPRPTQATSEVIEAALCVSERLKGVESMYSDQVLQAAHTQFKGGLGLQEVVKIAAEQNGGYRGSIRDLNPMLRAAWAGQQQGYDMAAGGPSTIAISGILSNVANKFLRVAFDAVENAWKMIVTTRSVSDFKQITTYSLVGDNIYEELAPGGKIKDGSLGEVSYTNQAKQFAKMLGIDFRDIRNDDLGALTGAGRKLGRGGALKICAVVWAEWLDDSTFFPTNKSKNNYDDGNTDSVLSLAGLVNADTIFRAQTNPQAAGDTGNATPLGSIPRILLVPAALRTTGWNLMNSQYVNLVTATTPTQGTENPWRGQFQLVDSTYLSAANGGSDTAWYLLADPNDISVLEVVFLDGQEMPIIEVGDPNFDELGIRMRGRHAFGAAKQEYRGAVKMKGVN